MLREFALFSAAASALFLSGVIPNQMALAQSACGLPVIQRMSVFLEKEKGRVIQEEERLIAALLARSSRMTPLDAAFLKEHQLDFETRTQPSPSSRLVLGWSASRSVAGTTSPAEEKALWPNTRELRRRVLSRVQSFPYRGLPAMRVGAVSSATALARLQLLKDQYTELHSWQASFLQQCSDGNSVGAVIASRGTR